MSCSTVTKRRGTCTPCWPCRAASCWCWMNTAMACATWFQAKARSRWGSAIFFKPCCRPPRPTWRRSPLAAPRRSWKMAPRFCPLRGPGMTRMAILPGRWWPVCRLHGWSNGCPAWKWARAVLSISFAVMGKCCCAFRRAMHLCGHWRAAPIFSVTSPSPWGGLLHRRCAMA